MSDLSINFVKDGSHIGYPSDADYAAVFTPDGSHIATFEQTASGYARLTEAPGSPKGFGDVTLDFTEVAIAEWADKNL